MKAITFLLLFVLSSHVILAQIKTNQRRQVINSVLTDPQCSPYIMFPKNSQACQGSDSALFITHAYNLDYIRWEKSNDSGLTWAALTPIKFVGLQDGHKDTLSINLNDTAAIGLLYRVHWFGCVDTTSLSVKIISTSPNTLIWTGYAEDNNWENTGNWPCGSVPNSLTDVQILSGEVFINSDVTINSLYVAPGATVSVNSGFTLTVLH